MAYVDVDFYKDSYAGIDIPDAKFDTWATKASSYLNYISGNRVASAPETDVKMAACAVAEVMYKLDSDDGVIISESSGSYSKTVQVGAGDTPDRRLYNAAKMHLAHTGVLYRGAY